MAQSRRFLFGKDARMTMRNGVGVLAQAVTTTLGARGRSAAIEHKFTSPEITLDGVTVAKEMIMEDQFENLGADIVRQAAQKTNDEVGDGTTTSIVLANALIQEGEEVVGATNFNVIKLAEELEGASIQVIKELEKQAEPVTHIEQIREVATISCKNNDIGKLVATVMSEIGKDGSVTLEDSSGFDTTYEVVEGLRVEKGYISPYLVTNQQDMTSELKNAYVLVANAKLSSPQELLPLLNKMIESGKKQLVVVADDCDGTALSTLIGNHLQGIFKVCVIQAPSFGDRRKEALEDIAVFTGATVYAPDKGMKLEDMTLEQLGGCRKVVSTTSNTTFIDGEGDKKEITKRIEGIKKLQPNAKNDYDKDRLSDRLSRLGGKVAIIYAGGHTETAQKELKQRIEDAVGATKAAMQEGIVPGGGIALFRAFSIVGAKQPLGDEITSRAYEILGRACIAPLEAIISNCGALPEMVVPKLLEGSLWEGFDAVTGKIVDLKKAGIVDPLKVTKTALNNAVSVASKYLTIGVAIVEKPVETK